jgi:hypothetical protein
MNITNFISTQVILVVLGVGIFLASPARARAQEVVNTQLNDGPFVGSFVESTPTVAAIPTATPTFVPVPTAVPVPTVAPTHEGNPTVAQTFVPVPTAIPTLVPATAVPTFVAV